jgi:hypothetical protein
MQARIFGVEIVCSISIGRNKYYVQSRKVVREENEKKKKNAV